MHTITTTSAFICFFRKLHIADIIHRFEINTKDEKTSEFYGFNMFWQSKSTDNDEIKLNTEQRRM